MNFFQNSTMHRGQIHYPFVMFGMKTSTKLDCYKNVSDKYFFPFFLHKSINQPQSCSKLLKFKKKKIQDFYSLIAKFINDVTDFGGKNTQNYFFFFLIRTEVD